MKQQQASDGRGIIASDEVYGVLNQCLIRSESGAASTGERQLLCSFWSGDGHTANFATKETTKVDRSALCIGGFTQPDKIFQLLQTLGSSNDGFLDRYLFPPFWSGCGICVYIVSKEVTVSQYTSEQWWINTGKQATFASEF